MLKGLLRPRPSDTDKWLFAIAKASGHSLHGEKRQLYPKRTIWLDETAMFHGDGSYYKPLKHISAIFDDNTLECVCQNLCTDKITIRVKNNLQSYIYKNLKGDRYSIHSFINGKNRDYNYRLVFRPWNDNERIKVKLICDLPVITTSSYIRIQQHIALLKNLHGTKWINTDFEIIFRLTTMVQPKEIKMYVDSRMICIDTCKKSIFVNCTFKNRIVIDALWRLLPDEIIGYDPDDFDGIPGDGEAGEAGDWDWDDGGWGYYPWPPSSEIDDDYSKYPWPPPPKDEESIIWTGEMPVSSFTTALYDCPNSIIRNSSCNMIADCQSEKGVKSESYGVVNSQNCDIKNFTMNCISNAIAEAGGLPVTSGIAGFDLTALSLASGIINCKKSKIDSCKATTNAKALANALNEPYIEKDGVKKTLSIGGFSQAIATGFTNNNNSKFQNCNADVFSYAKHPVLWGYKNCAFYYNLNSVFSNCIQPESLCKSNDLAYCLVNNCDIIK